MRLSYSGKCGGAVWYVSSSWGVTMKRPMQTMPVARCGPRSAPHRACRRPTREAFRAPSGLGSSATILPGPCRPWSREADVGCRFLEHRVIGERASMRHNEAPETEQANGLTLVGYHDLDHRPAFTMAMQVMAAMPPNALRSSQRCFGSGRHGIHARMSGRGI